MNTLDIIKNNKSIAIFMGGKTSNTNGVATRKKEIWLPIFGICRWDTIDVARGKILKYHKNWDWLIPVIDKITSDETYIQYKNDTSNIFCDAGININTRFIISTYNDVANFIKWYNTH